MSAKMDPDNSFTFTDQRGRPHSRLGATSMEEYLRCPRLWHYKARFEPIGLPSPWPLIGTAIHAGLAAFYRGQTGPVSPAPPADPREVALAEIRSIWAENADLNLEAAEKLVSSGLAVAMAHPLDGQVIAVEMTIGDCTPDLVMSTPAGLVVWDHKWKHRVEEQWMDKELRGTATLHQLWHNAMRVSQAAKQPVVGIGKLLIVSQPKTRARPYFHAISLKRLVAFTQAYEIHRARAIQDDARWRAEGISPPQNFTSCWDYGGCPYRILCHDLEGDETKASNLYTVKPL